MDINLMNRRDWLRAAACSVSIAGLGSAANGNFRHPLGVQLYTVRNVMKGHEEEVIRRIAEIGYKEVETAGGALDALWPILNKYKLRATSSHLDVTALDHPDQIEKSIGLAKQHEVQYLVYPYVMPNQRGGPDEYKRLADKMNKAGEQIHAAGLTFCYHNHAFEFGGSKGERAIDVFNANLDKKLVNFEVDVFWVSVAGNDPVALLKEFSGRVPLVHLKDKASGTAAQYNEGVPKETFKEVGSGSLDFPAILKTAESVGVKHYFVEQDQTPGDPIDSLKKSYDYLRSVSV